MKRLTVIIVLVILLAGCANTGGADPPEAVTAMPNITETPPRTPAVTTTPTLTPTPDFRQPTWTPTISNATRPEGTCFRSDLPITWIDPPRLRWSGSYAAQGDFINGFDYPVSEVTISPDKQYAILTLKLGAHGQVVWYAALLVDMVQGGIQWLDTDIPIGYPTFEWLPDGGLLWLDAEGELWQWDGEENHSLNAPIPMDRLWLTSAGTVITDPCHRESSLYRLDLATGDWEEISAEAATANTSLSSSQLQLSNDGSYLLGMSLLQGENTMGDVLLWRIPAEMGEPAERIIGDEFEIWGTDAYFPPGNQYLDTPYWHYNRPMWDGPYYVDERDGSLHTPQELGISTSATDTFPVQAGQTLLARFDDGALILSYPYNVLWVNPAGEIVDSLYLPARGGISVVERASGVFLMGTTTEFYAPFSAEPGDVCPCGLVEWKTEPNAE